MLFAIFFVLSAIALAFFLVPWFRAARAETALPRQGVNTLLFRDRLQELDNERETGKIDPEQFAQLKAELEVNFLADVRAEEGEAVATSRAPRWGAMLLVIALPAISLSVYIIEGQLKEVESWLQTKQRWAPLIEGSLQGKPVDPEQAKDLTAGDYIRVLQSILQRSPEHVAGWRDLGTAYMQVGLYHFAESAFQRASTLVPDDPELMLMVVESKMGQGKGALDESGLSLLQRVLQVDAGNPKARMMMGMASYSRGDYDNAISVWQTLLQDTPPGSEGAKILQSSIERARTKRDATSVASSTATSNTAASNTAAPAASAGEGVPQLKVSVTVNPQVQAEMDGSWSLMVYAKAVGGMPMPVAIEKIPYVQAPVTVVLDDQDAMAPMARLSTSKTVKVFARLSRSGQATPQAGDYMVESGEIGVQPGQQAVGLEIAQIVN